MAACTGGTPVAGKPPHVCPPTGTCPKTTRSGLRDLSPEEALNQNVLPFIGAPEKGCDKPLDAAHDSNRQAPSLSHTYLTSKGTANECQAERKSTIFWKFVQKKKNLSRWARRSSLKNTYQTVLVCHSRPAPGFGSEKTRGPPHRPCVKWGTQGRDRVFTGRLLLGQLWALASLQDHIERSCPIMALFRANTAWVAARLM